MLSTDSISIIMPAFNAEKTITRAIESIQKQTYKNWQLIIVNDGSKDATQEIMLWSMQKGNGLLFVMRMIGLRKMH